MDGFWENGKFILRSTIENREATLRTEVSRLEEEKAALQTDLNMECAAHADTIGMYVAMTKSRDAWREQVPRLIRSVDGLLHMEACRLFWRCHQKGITDCNCPATLEKKAKNDKRLL